MAKRRLAEKSGTLLPKVPSPIGSLFTEQIQSSGHIWSPWPSMAAARRLDLPSVLWVLR